MHICELHVMWICFLYAISTARHFTLLTFFLLHWYTLWCL